MLHGASNAAVLPSFLFKIFSKNPRLKIKQLCKYLPSRLRKKQGIEGKERSILSSIKQNFEVESLVLFMRKQSEIL